MPLLLLALVLARINRIANCSEKICLAQFDNYGLTAECILSVFAVHGDRTSI